MSVKDGYGHVVREAMTSVAASDPAILEVARDAWLEDGDWHAVLRGNGIEDLALGAAQLTVHDRIEWEWICSDAAAEREARRAAKRAELPNPETE